MRPVNVISNVPQTHIEGPTLPERSLDSYEGANLVGFTNNYSIIPT